MTGVNKRLFEPCDDGEVEQLNIGSENQPLLKVEGCIKGANRLKEFAVRVNNFKAADSFYPGLRMPVIDLYPLAIAKFYQPYIDRAFGLDFTRVKKVASTYSIVTTPPSQLGYLQCVPHIDAPSKNSLAMIHYLCDAPNEGTALFRHKPTGYEYVDASRYDKYMECVETQKSRVRQKDRGYMGTGNDQYSMLTSFGAKFNRLLMYRGSSLHSGLIGPNYKFDPSPATGRLTVTTFIEFAD